MLFLGAEQFAALPPLIPLQVHSHLEVKLTIEADPYEQSEVLGVLVDATPLANPQVPFTGIVILFVAQEAVVPPLEPVQVQLHGPDPETADAVPAKHKFVVGIEKAFVALADPQAPLIAGLLLVAVQVAFVPPLEPWQVQVTEAPAAGNPG